MALPPLRAIEAGQAQLSDVTVISIVGNNTRSSDFRRSLQSQLSTLPLLEACAGG
jgi:hypothetical protein